FAVLPATRARATSLAQTDSGTILEVGASRTAPAYEVHIERSPFRITTKRDGEIVLQTTASAPAAVDFGTASGVIGTTDVRGVDWSNGVLSVDVGTTDPSRSVHVVLAPEKVGYRLTANVSGERPNWVALHYDMPASGHWYGHGETVTAKGGPYT